MHLSALYKRIRCVHIKYLQERVDVFLRVFNSLLVHLTVIKERFLLSLDQRLSPEIMELPVI